MSSFSQGLWAIKENASGVVYARANSYADQRYAVLNGSSISFRDMLDTDGETWHGMPLAVFTTDKTKNMTARAYFEGVIRKYH